MYTQANRDAMETVKSLKEINNAQETNIFQGKGSLRTRDHDYGI